MYAWSDAYRDHKLAKTTGYSYDQAAALLLFLCSGVTGVTAARTKVSYDPVGSPVPECTDGNSQTKGQLLSGRLSSPLLVFFHRVLGGV